MKNGRFRIIAWDHMLLCGQIVSVQFSVYFFLSLLMLFFALIFGSKYSALFLFSYRVITFSESDGKLIIIVFIVNSFLSAVLLRCIVKRAKQCLDFSCTFHGFHLFICWWYNSAFPCNLSWWLLNILTSAVMCIGGEILCLKSELENISLGYSALTEKSDV